MRETGVLHKRPFAKTKKKGWVKNREQTEGYVDARGRTGM